MLRSLFLHRIAQNQRFVGDDDRAPETNKKPRHSCPKHRGPVAVASAGDVFGSPIRRLI
jgi:hypothetical protein